MPDTILYTLCSVDGCTAPSKAREWCAKHYERWRRHGDPSKINRPKPCRAEGCSLLGAGKGWCDDHFLTGRRRQHHELNRRRRSNPALNDHDKSKTTARRRAMRQMLGDYKQQKGCIDCGFNEHAAALEFDHVRGTKLSTLSAAVAQGWAEQRVWDEVAKCEVRCSNCHAVRTYEQQRQAE